MSRGANPTADLAEFAASIEAESLPSAVRERTKDLLLDAIGCALAADRAEEIAQIDRFADLLGDHPMATVIGRGELRPPLAAAMLNGYRITALTACDVYTPAHFHVTPEVVPAALVVAERTKASGATLLASLAAGFEVATRVAAGLHYESFRARGWHTPGVAGPFGAAAAVARLLALDPVRVRNALGLAGSQSAGTWAAWGTPAVKFHQARGAASGLLAGMLAETGFDAAVDVLGHPDGGLLHAYSDGGDPAAIVDALGDRWEVTRISLRPWPGATPLQPIITGLFRLIAEGRLTPPSSASLRIFVAPSVHRQHARFRHPTGTFEAMLSIDYAAAVILRFGRLGVEEFMPEAYGLADLREAIDRQVEVVSDDTLTPLQCRLEVRSSGWMEVLPVDLPKGHPDDPATRDLLGQKFLEGAAGVLGVSRAHELLARLDHLEDEPDVANLCRLMRPSEPRQIEPSPRVHIARQPHGGAAR